MNIDEMFARLDRAESEPAPKSRAEQAQFLTEVSAALKPTHKLTPGGLCVLRHPALAWGRFITSETVMLLVGFLEKPVTPLIREYGDVFNNNAGVELDCEIAVGDGESVTFFLFVSSYLRPYTAE